MGTGTAFQNYVKEFSNLDKATQQAILSSGLLSKAQKEQLISQMELSASTATLTAEQVQERLATELNSEADAKALLAKSGLITEKELETGATVEITTAKLNEAVANGTLSTSDAAVIAGALGITGANTTATTSFGLLTKAVWANVKAIGAWLLTTPAGWATLAIGAIAGLTIVYQKATLTIDEATDALEESKSSYDSISGEVSQLTEELTNCQKRIKELEEIGSLRSIVEDDELEKLQSTNVELTRRLAILKEEQRLKAVDVAKDASNVMTTDVESQYSTIAIGGSDERGQKVKPEEEMRLAINAYREYAEEKAKIDAELLKDPENTELANESQKWQDKMDLAASRANEMAGYINQTEEAYKKVIDTGGTLTSTQTDLYNSSIALGNEYLAFTKEINGVNEAFENLDTTEKAQSLKNKYAAKKVSLPNGQGTYTVEDKEISDWIDTLPDDDLTVLASINFSGEQTKDSMQEALDYAKNNVDGNTDKTDILSFSDAWKQLKNSTEDTTKGLADNLTELAEKGQLTVEALSEADTTDFFKNAGISAEEAVDKINELVSASTQLNALSGQISKMSDMLADKKNGTVASASDLAGFDAEVRGLDTWEEFEKVMGSAESTMEQCQKAANDLATEWVNNGNFLSNLTDENKDYYITQLNNMGIENAEAIVTEALAQKKNDLALATQFAEEKGKDLSKATVDEITKFADEHNMAGEARNALYRLALAKKGVSAATLTFDGDITNIKNFVQSISGAAYALAEMEAIKKNPSAYVPSEVKQKILDQARTEVSNATNSPVEVDFDLKDTGSSNYKGSGGKSGGGKSGGSSKDAKKKFSETFDWIEIRIKRLERAISNYDNVIDNTYNSWSKRNKALEKEITKITSLITAQQKAQDTYKKKADKVTVKNTSEDGKSTKKQEEAFKKYKKLVREGSLKISDIKDEDVANAVKKYQEYYEKSLDAQDNKTEAQKQLLDAYVKKFDMVSEKYDSIIGIYDTKKSNWETAYKGNIEAQGRDMNLAETKEYTSKRNSYEEKTQAQLEKERAELRKKQAEAVKKGLRKDSQEYKDMEKAILEVDQALQESKNIVANTAQEIREAAIAEFNETSEKYDSIISIFEANKSTMDSTVKNAIESTGRQMNYGEASVYYNNLNNIQANTQAQLVNEIAELQQKLAQAVANGVDQNSNDYRSMQAELINAQNALQDSKNAVNENTLALLQTKWSDIQKDIDALDETLSDSEFTRNMISNMGDLYTKSVGSKPTKITGTMTDYGKATLSTYFNDINTNQAKIAKAQEGYKDVLSKLATDPNNDAYKNQANSFKQEIENATLAIYSSKDDIVSLYSDMFNEMLDSLKKISDNTMNQLQTEKDLYDYQKSIREKTDNISLLQRQLNVYKNDTSESGKMNYQQIKSQLAEVKTDLGDTEYSRFLSDTQSLLDQMNDDASDWVEQTLADKTTLITNALDTVNESTKTVNSSIIGVQTAISNLNSSTSDTNNSTTTTTDTNKSTTTPVMPGGMNHVPTITLPTPAIIDKGGTILDSKVIANPNKLSTKLAGHPNSIKQGTKNNSFVGLVNQALTKLGYKTNSGNGYGDTTAAAVKKFCQDNKVNIDSKTKKTKASGKTMGNDFFKKLISVLKAKGYSRGGVITDDDFDLSNLGIRTNNGDTKLITVKNGERVLTPIQNQNFEELIKYLQANPIVPNIPTNLVSNIPQAKNVGGNSYSTNIEHVDLSFPDVTNYEDFVQKLKHDNTTLKYIAAQTAGAYVGKNSLKNRL